MSNLNTEDKQSQIAELREELAYDLLCALESAETCETEADFTANLDEAIEAARKLVTDLEALRK
jgi:hypothetical protein